jgi:hypothetical protein
LLDTSSHPCASLAVHTGECTSAAAEAGSCTAAHVCRDSCVMCERCLQATRNFEQLPKILRGLAASGDYRQHAEAVSFFKVGFAGGLSLGSGALRGRCNAGCDLL